ncbi:small G protein signaling modulator 1-like isoform X3 [Salvelinus fontinalis]|nr:small G protein signaling modulator 1-like isoform X3 [Salvelinus fontinalis]
MEAIPGYLSLHQTAHIMTLKWTPNQLMNGSVGDLDYEHSVYWDYAMTIRLEEIVYLHCHQQVDTGGTVVLVSQDGIQRPPLRFPRGGHLLQFLSCLENGLLPHGQLDPPLWSQRGKGKVFPKLRNRCSQGSSDSVSDKEEDEATDYVFRILFPNSQSEFVAPELMDQEANIWQPTTRKSSCSSCTQCSFSDGGPPNGCNHERAPLKLLCDQMKYQIISRAFYGWLAYCRHLSTVRTHLSALVNHTIVTPDAPGDALGGLTAEVWQRFLQDCTAYKEQELLRLVYFGGVDPSLRKEVWPFLLGHYQFGMSEADRKEVDEQVRACYEQTMSEWLGCEAIVRQREKEQHAAALAKCSSISASVDNPSTVQRMMHRDSSVSNESSQSCCSDRQSLARLQSDSDSSTQVFESVEEVEQIETEPKSEEAKPVPKIPNGGGLPNVASSPDSGHPSSRNFSVTSCMSDHSLSTEDSTVPDTNPKTTISTPPQLAPGQQIPVKAHQEVLEADDPNFQPLALQDEKDLQAKDLPDKEEKEKEESVTEVAQDTEDIKTEDPEVKMGKNPETAEDRAADPAELESLKIEGKTSMTLSNEKDEVRTSEKEDSKLPEAEVDAVKETVESKTREAKEPDAEVMKMLDGEPTMQVHTEEMQSMEPGETGETKENKGPEPESVDPEENKTSQANHREPKGENTLISTVTAEAMEDTASEMDDERTSDTGSGETKSAETTEVKEANATNVEKTETEKEVEANQTFKSEEVVETKVYKTVSPEEVAEAKVEEIKESEEVGKREEKTILSEAKLPESKKNKSPVAETRVGRAMDSTTKLEEALATTESDESPSGIEMEEISSAKFSMALPWDRKFLCESSGIGAALSEGSVHHLELRLEENEKCKPSPEGTESIMSEEPEMESLFPKFEFLTLGGELKISPVPSIGTTYSQELLDMYTINLHRIEKDVQRCDRNYWYFTPANLEKLRNIMCSYIWQHLEIGYVQGMCDLLAPLLVIMDDEAMAFSCFTELMKRMNQNFPHGGAMDTHFANMRSLIQILDSEIFELMHQNGDYTHFYFCYRWFLLDLKRELVYDDVFAVWETIWAAKDTSSGHFVLFIALALVEVYRDIILENNMDFTDIIKFFNEMAEHHNIKQILTLARDLVCKVQTLIENK